MLKLPTAFFRSSHWHTRWLMIAVFCIALWVCAPGIHQCAQKWNDNVSPSWVGVTPDKAKEGDKICDVDTRLIHLGFLAAPQLKDTTRWLTGIWVGQVPFYRPLTSYVFWTQWRVWGDYEARYNLVAILAHLLAVAAFARLAHALLRIYRLPYPVLGTLLAGLLFVYGLGLLSAQETITAETYLFWKNQPDSLTLLFFSCGLTAYLKQKTALVQSRWLAIAPALWFVLLCLTKEAGVFFPLLLPIIEAPELRKASTRRAALLRLLPFALLLPLYLGLRTVFLHDAVGYRYGSNDAWLFRFFNNCIGGVGEAISLHADEIVADTIILCLSILYLVCLRRWGRSTRGKATRLLDVLPVVAGPLAILLIVAAVLGWRQVSPVNTFNIAATLLQLAAWEELGQALGATVFLLCVGRALWQRPNFGVLCYAWALLTLGLTLFSPSVLHRYYLMNAGFSVLIAGGALLWLAPLMDAVVKRVQQAQRVNG